MPLLTNNISIPVNFIHIPRTGGRYTVELLLLNNYDFIFRREHPYYFANVIDNVEVIHFHASLMKRHYKDYCYAKPFTIVRDPIDRFISGFFVLHEFSIDNNMSHLLTTPDIVKVIDSAQKSLNNNWFRPQHEFILPKTKIWKYENGLGYKFINWLKSELSIDITIHNNQIIGKTDNKKQINKFSDDVLDSVKQYYSEDYLIE
jgi:hypothetical protein